MISLAAPIMALPAMLRFNLPGEDAEWIHLEQALKELS